MTKQKRSFLDRIIGSGEEKEDDEIMQQSPESRGDVKEEVNVDPEEDINRQTLEKEIEKEIKAEAENQKKLNLKSEDFSEENSKKEWFKGKENSSSEEEGQLTIDVYQTKDSVVIKSIIGGVRPEDLDISIASDMVTIKGKRLNPDEVSSENYYYQECFWGNFSRSVILPGDVRTDGMVAKMKNGILTVTLPKIEKNSSMKIKVSEE